MATHKTIKALTTKALEDQKKKPLSAPRQARPTINNVSRKVTPPAPVVKAVVEEVKVNRYIRKEEAKGSVGKVINVPGVNSNF